MTDDTTTTPTLDAAAANALAETHALYVKELYAIVEGASADLDGIDPLRGLSDERRLRHRLAPIVSKIADRNAPALLKFTTGDTGSRIALEPDAIRQDLMVVVSIHLLRKAVAPAIVEQAMEEHDSKMLAFDKCKDDTAQKIAALETHLASAKGKYDAAAKHLARIDDCESALENMMTKHPALTATPPALAKPKPTEPKSAVSKTANVQRKNQPDKGRE